MKHTLEADGINLEFGNRKILSDIYLKCETGKITGLLGRNGNGKSCLMNIIYGTLNATDKSIRLDGRPLLQAYKKPEILLYLPQFNFIPKFLKLKSIFTDFNLEYNELESLFPEFKTKYNSRIKNLSGGQRRLIEIYIVLKSNSKFALLDEPFSHLSPLMIETVKELLLETKKTKGLLVTDHMFRDIIDVSDDLYLLTGGRTHLTKDIKELEFLGYAKL
ncbi:ATP-binding cassette domain-containing protein [Pedobacter frigoris]|uniref:ATP-binding cassette domain-containing protein n=1 Tax=Pedobacter frigoris TaxID=2571272 RepID=A0A4U1CCM6_9SPHI|nr:ATP-binding cassette domain-containing protein [Pedobacter frigoris]TKC03738.1 ATP-binding cassette domain-containing protein [Pedobacter frigoris]